MKKIILVSLLLSGKALFAQNTFPTSGNVGIGTTNPNAYFGGPVLQIEGQRPVLRFAPSLSGGLGTILFKGAFSEGFTGSEDEFHLNYMSNPVDPYIALGGYKNGPKTLLTLKGAGNVGIGTDTPNSTLTIRSGSTGVSIHPGTSPYFGTLAFNREAGTGAIFDPSGKAFQINNGGGDQNLHVQVYNGDGNLVTDNSLVISGTNGNVGVGVSSPSSKLDVNGVFHVVSPAFSEYNGGQGTYIGWNKSGGGGEVNFVNSIGGGTISGFAFDDTSDGISFNRLMTIHGNGNVGIGTNNPQDKLTVAGKIGACEIRVTTNAGADFVFEPDYQLTELAELEKFVKAHKHLPEIPTAKQMVKDGVNLGELNIKLLQKVEELTLHLIEKEKQLRDQGDKVFKLEAKLTQQEKTIQEILKKIKQ